MADHRAPPRVLCAVEPITAPREPAWARIPPEALGGWCLLRSSKPLSGSGCGVGGGFDSHALPPIDRRSKDSKDINDTKDRKARFSSSLMSLVSLMSLPLS